MVRLVHFLLAACLLFGPFASPVHAAALPILPPPSYHSVFLSPHEFHPSSSSCSYEVTAMGLVNLPPNGCVMIAPIILSGDAAITGATFYYRDNSSVENEDLRFYINAYDISTSSDVNKLYGATSGQPTSPDVRALTIDSSGHVIDIDNSMAYTVEVFLPSDATGLKLTFNGVRIDYRMPGIVSEHDEYITLRGDSFLPTRSDIHYSNTGPAIQLTQMPATNPAIGHFVFPLSLPQGAAVSEVQFSYVDAAPESLQIMLGDFTISTGGGISSANATTSDNSAALRSTTVPLSPAITVGANKQFLLYFRPAALQHMLYTVRVKYTPPSTPTNTLVLSSSNFLPTNSATSYTRNGILLSGNEGAEFQAGFHLPANTGIRRITLYVIDNNTAGANWDMQIKAYASQPGVSGDRITPIVATSSLPDKAVVQAVELPATNLGTINPTQRYYNLMLTFQDDSNLSFVGAIIEYYDNKPVYVPALTK